MTESTPAPKRALCWGHGGDFHGMEHEQCGVSGGPLIPGATLCAAVLDRAASPRSPSYDVKNSKDRILKIGTGDEPLGEAHNENQ